MGLTLLDPRIHHILGIDGYMLQYEINDFYFHFTNKLVDGSDVVTLHLHIMPCHL